MTFLKRRNFIQMGLLFGLSSCLTNNKNQRLEKMNKPIIIAHRGASGYRPEHTLASYELAIEQNCDFIEPDLVMTKDGHLICRHENDITNTTNVSQKNEFLNRKTIKIIDGEKHEGWFSEDFTLSEIKTLRAIERLPQLRPQNIKYNEQFEIPTFQEVLELRARKSKEKNRNIGVYPETKHPSYFAKNNLFFDDVLIELLSKYSMNTKESPVFIQSFETQNLISLAKKTKVKLIQLMQEEGGPWNNQNNYDKTYKQMASIAGLTEISKYAYGIGPEKTMILPRNNDGKLLAPSELINNAHNLGLKLHPWTFRVENYFLPLEFKSSKEPQNHGNLIEEIRLFQQLGIDGFFCDFPDIAYQAIHGH